MVPFFIIVLFISAIAVPMFLEEQKKERLMKLRNQEQMRSYGSNPFAPNGAFEPGLMDVPLDEPNPMVQNGFSDFEPPTLNLVQPLNPHLGSEGFSPIGYHPEPIYEVPESSQWSDSAKDFLEFHQPFTDISIPEIDATEGSLKQLIRTAIFLSMAYQAGVSKTQAYSEILGIHKGGNKAYKLFELIWNEIRNFG
jgi:hypothetical protein